MSIDTGKLQTGSHLSEIKHWTVKSDKPTKDATGNYMWPLEDEHGERCWVSDDYVKTGMKSSVQYSETKKVTMTEMQEIFSKAFGHVFQVTFKKQLKEKDLFDKIHAIYNPKDGKFRKRSETDKELKEALKKEGQGETRVLTGYLIENKADGHSRVQDLDKNGLRLVNRRTISELIYNGTRYQLKK